MEEELTFESIEDYQKYLKQRQELMAYCKKISQGIENLDEKSGERAIWELVQNARDMDENCRIRIELTADSIVFSHHGKPFDYTSLLALVNQNSNKDNPGADLVGQYGTGFMTTHAFNDIVKVSAPYKAMNGPVALKGYIHMQGFELNRSYRNNLERAIKEMGDEMQLVDDMHKRTPLYPSYEALEESQKWTSFTYGLDSNTVKAVSSQLTSAVRLMPFVLVINDRIKEVEVDDQYAKRHFRVAKTANADKQTLEDSSKWYRVTDKIETTDLKTQTKSLETVVSLQSFNQENKVEDVVILPPYPKSCGLVSSIPSLFLWFPLLGTENFGVNFIFHSKRWHPVEKRNNIMLPENVPSKIEKGAHNESVLREMMEALHKYYAIEGNDVVLMREMCVVNFHSDKEDEVTTQFYSDLQDLWKNVVPAWNVVPTTEGRKAMNDCRVRVLHPDFYNKLSEEKRIKYEATLAEYAKAVKQSEQECYLTPSEDLIAWSVVVDQWRCNRDSDFFITVKDVCQSIQSKSDKLFGFLSFLVDSENAGLLDDYELLPNRKGNLKKRGELRQGDFMTPPLYALTELLMGSDADRMIDLAYNGIGKAANYKPEDLQRAISQTVTQWRNSTLGNNKIPLTTEQLNALIEFCSATSQSEFNNYRGRMMSHRVKVHGTTLTKREQPKVIEKEDDFYNPAFNLLLDYTLYVISTKDDQWVKDNEQLLKDFLTEYATSNANDRLAKLDEYGVIPNHYYSLCIKKDLYKNANINEELAKLYLDVKKEDLHDHWVHENFAGTFTYDEQKASDVANKIQTKLSDDDFQDTIVLEIIELAENETIDSWKVLFKAIYAQRESIRYKLGTPAERKAINRMMKQKNPALLEKMADVAEREDSDLVLRKLNEAISNIEDEAHKKMLGDFVEDHIERYLNDALSGFGVNIRNEQGGQDLILSKEGCDDYYIEIKSRWIDKEPAMMSSLQFHTAVAKAECYALISAQMWGFDQQRVENGEVVSLSELKNRLRVCDNIGTLEKTLLDKVEEALVYNEDEIHVVADYHVHVPQKLITQSFDELISSIIKHFTKCEE